LKELVFPLGSKLPVWEDFGGTGILPARGAQVS
jgi:hypothetical protein